MLSQFYYVYLQIFIYNEKYSFTSCIGFLLAASCLGSCLYLDNRNI